MHLYKYNPATLYKYCTTGQNLNKYWEGLGHIHGFWHVYVLVDGLVLRPALLLVGVDRNNGE